MRSLNILELELQKDIISSLHRSIINYYEDFEVYLCVVSVYIVRAATKPCIDLWLIVCDIVVFSVPAHLNLLHNRA